MFAKMSFLSSSFFFEKEKTREKKRRQNLKIKKSSFPNKPKDHDIIVQKKNMYQLHICTYRFLIWWQLEWLSVSSKLLFLIQPLTRISKYYCFSVHFWIYTSDCHFIRHCVNDHNSIFLAVFVVAGWIFLRIFTKSARFWTRLLLALKLWFHYLISYYGSSHVEWWFYTKHLFSVWTGDVLFLLYHSIHICSFVHIYTYVA